MSACKVKTNSRWARRVRRQFAAMCAGFNATTDYCPIRKRKYRKCWIRGMYLRKGWAPAATIITWANEGADA